MSKQILLKRRRSDGFTLIEMVVSIAIFSLIGLGTYTLFSSVFNLKEKTDIRSHELSNLQRAMIIIQNDVEQLVRRDARDVFGDSASALVGADNQMVFTRSGWNLSPFSKSKRSILQRVRYQVEEGELIRSHWNMLDQADQAEPEHVTLLKGVEEIRLRYLDRDPDAGTGDSWHDAWPPSTLNTSTDPDYQPPVKIPLVVEMEMVHERYV